jgi:F-type H+-transporting ATPase subunit gamma
MPVQSKIIKQKIKSVANIKKITKTMEMVSVSKMRKSTIRTLGSRTYAILGLKLVAYLQKMAPGTHPLMSEKETKTGKILVVLYGGNKGLCGGYHVNLFKMLSLSLKNTKDEVHVVTIGKYAEKIANKLKYKIIASFVEFNESSNNESLEVISKMIQKKFLEAEYDNVYMCYTEFIKTTMYKPIYTKLLPASMELFENIVDAMGDSNSKESHTEYDFSNTTFEPSLSAILDAILPSMVTTTLYQALAESHASEHSARMFAMKNAGDNASDLLDDLQLTYNNARQSAITQEISEIVGGASALQVD